MHFVAGKFLERFAKPESARPKHQIRHQPDAIRNARTNLEVSKHVPIEIDSGRNLEHDQAMFVRFKDGAFRNEKGPLASCESKPSIVGALFDRLDEASMPSFLLDAKAPVLQACDQTPRSQGAKKADRFGVLGNMNESSGTVRLAGKTTDVDVPSAIDLREGEECDVKAAAVIEVELRGLLDERLVVDSGPEVIAADRSASDDSLLDRQRDGVGQAFFHEDASNTGRHPVAKIGDTTGEELKTGAAGDDGA